MTLFLGLFLIGMLGLSCLSTSIFKQQDQALAQQSIQTIKYRNLVIDLDNSICKYFETKPGNGSTIYPDHKI
jgi:hypothetical protein